MKYILSLLLLLTFVKSFAQTDANGNPVFNSVATSEETINGFVLMSNYYTLKNNIENKGSSVYISPIPTIDEVINAAIKLPSDFFIVNKDGGMTALILLTRNPDLKFAVIDPVSGDQKIFNCALDGDITENRATELINEKYHPDAKIKGDKLLIDNRKLRIVSNKDIRREVLQLISKEKLDASKGGSVKVLSAAETRKMILEETKEGGRLDFFTPIKDHEYDAILVKPKVFSTQIGVALYKWGKANYDFGVNTTDDALSIFEEFKGRKLNQREIDYIKMGFNKELEK